MRSGVASVDEEKEEEEAGSSPNTSNRVVPLISFNEVATADPETSAQTYAGDKIVRHALRRKTKTTWADKKRISLAQKKINDPAWM